MLPFRSFCRLTYTRISILCTQKLVSRVVAGGAKDIKSKGFLRPLFTRTAPRTCQLLSTAVRWMWIDDATSNLHPVAGKFFDRQSQTDTIFHIHHPDSCSAIHHATRQFLSRVVPPAAAIIQSSPDMFVFFVSATGRRRNGRIFSLHSRKSVASCAVRQTAPLAASVQRNSEIPRQLAR